MKACWLKLPVRATEPGGAELRRPRAVFVVAALTIAAAAAGCSQVGSTARRSGAVALGAGVGGAAGYALGDKDPVKTAIGAALGAGLTTLALGQDPDVRQSGFDEGYVQGQSDAIKRQYFLRHALEKQPLEGAVGGETVYYLLPGPEVTSDGRRLEPHQVAVRVVE